MTTWKQVGWRTGKLEIASLPLFLILTSLPPLVAQETPACGVLPGLESSLLGNAGCLIKIDDEMLVVQQCQTNLLSPPAGTAKEGETAQCTAHRETWEETGVEVRVGRLLKTFDNGFHLFHCMAVDEAIIRNSELQVPEAFRQEICEILFLNPTLSSEKDWRFPVQLAVFKDALKRISSQPGED